MPQGGEVSDVFVSGCAEQVTVAMDLSEANHHTMSKPALLKKVVEAEKHKAPRGPKTGRADTHDTTETAERRCGVVR